MWQPVLCRICTDKRIYDGGEAALAYGTAISAAAGTIRDLVTLIISMDPLGNEAIWGRLYKSTFRGQSSGPVVFSGISTLDIALWGIKGKYFHVPICKLLGGKHRDNLRTYASRPQFGWGDVCCDSVEISAPYNAATVTDYVRGARKTVTGSYDRIKIGFFTFTPEDGHRHTDEDRTRLLPPEKVHIIGERVTAVREAISPGMDITMENHSYLDTQPAVQLGWAVQRYGILYFEEPNTPNVKTTKSICDKLTVPISYGEQLYSRWQYAPLFGDQSIQVIQPGLGDYGGLMKGKKICDMTHIYDISVQAHACVNPLSTTAALRLETVIPNFVIHGHYVFNPHEYNRELYTVDL